MWGSEMAGRCELEAGRFRAWASDGRKTYDTAESVMYLTDIYQGTLVLPEIDNGPNQDSIRGTRTWPISSGSLRAGTTFAQGMVRLTSTLWDRDWMTIGGSLCTVQRIALLYNQNGYPYDQPMQTQYLTLEIQAGALSLVENYGVLGRAGMGGLGFNIPTLTFEYVIATGGFN